MKIGENIMGDLDKEIEKYRLMHENEKAKSKNQRGF